MFFNKKIFLISFSINSAVAENNVSSEETTVDITEENHFNNNDLSLQENNDFSSQKNVFYVDVNGNDSHDGLSKDYAFKSFNKALNHVNNSDTLIYVGEGVYNFSSEEYMWGGLFIDSNANDLYIVGDGFNNTVFDAGSVNRIFTISSISNIYLINLTLCNGFDLYEGGSIYNNGNLTIINCVFYNNKAFNGNSVNFGTSSKGGAIYNKGKLNIDNSYFYNNIVGCIYQEYAYGGVIYTEDEVNINNSYFYSNGIKTRIDPAWSIYDSSGSPQLGGVIAGFTDNVNISNSIFTNNQLKAMSTVDHLYMNSYIYSQGGVVYLKGNNVDFYNCSFIDNHADAGGVISIFGSNISFDLCDFLNNSAYFCGGGIFIVDYDMNKLSLLNKSVNTLENVSITRSNFINNSVFNSKSSRVNFGAAAAYLKADNNYIINSSFINNGYSITTASPYGHGGAIFTFGENKSFVNCVFENNKGDVGGAIMDQGLNTLIVNSSFIRNYANRNVGGAIYHNAGDFLIINNSYFDSNFALSNGGAVYSVSLFWGSEYYNNHYSIYENSVFINNSANRGGAVYDNGDYVKYINSDFKNNFAVYGGAIYNIGLSNKFLSCDFTNNNVVGSDYSNGGAIFNNGANTEFNDCYFADNFADNHGGAIYNSGNDIYCYGSCFINNSAFRGGALYLNGNGGNIINNTFDFNSAIYGGSVFNEASSVRISYNNFYNSFANVSGGGIYNTGNNLALYANYMFNCRSSLSGYGYGDYIYTTASISYLIVSFLNNNSMNILDSKQDVIFANVTDNMGNPVSGGNVTFILEDMISGQSVSIGVVDVYEGIASMYYGDNLKNGYYMISGNYIYAINPILTKKGELLSLLTSTMNLNLLPDVREIVIGGTIHFDIVLIDSNNNYISNAEIKVYENGVYKVSLFTDDNGYLKNVLSSFYLLGKYHYQFVYGGDLNHNRAVVDLTINVVYNEIFNKTKIISFIPVIVADLNQKVKFSFLIVHDDNIPLSYASTSRYFAVYRNGEYYGAVRTIDNEGMHGGPIVLGASTNVYGLFNLTVGGRTDLTDFMGNLVGFVAEDTPGIYVFTIVFRGGHVSQFIDMVDSYGNSYMTINKSSYSSSNYSVILIVNHENASENVSINVDGIKNISEIQYSNFTVNLTDSKGNILANKTVFLYIEGNLIGNYTTNSNGEFNFSFNHFFDVGQHLIQLVYSGDEFYKGNYNSFILNVHENPDKILTNFDCESNLNLSGRGNIFVNSLVDFNGNPLVNKPVNVNVYLDDKLFKTFNVFTNGSGQFNISLEWGFGVFTIECIYDGDKYIKNSSSYTIVNVTKIQSVLYGVTSLEVTGEDNYLVLVLVDNDYNIMDNYRIKIDVYSQEDNTTYYAFTNGSGVARLKIVLTPGEYYVFSSFAGDDWYTPSDVVLTNLTIYGSGSSLITEETLILIDNGYYSVYLKDDKGNPLVDQTVLITVNDVTYSRVTNSFGLARLKINLAYGYYEISSFFKGNIDFKSSNVLSHLLVVTENYQFPSVISTNKTMTFKGKGNYFSVFLSDIFSKPLVNESIVFTINGVSYSRLTNNDGIASLRINLNTGHYEISSSFKGNTNFTGTSFISDLIIVDENAVSTSLSGSLYNLFRGKGNYFNVTLKDAFNDPLVGETVLITVNGVTYSRITDGDGIARLRINLAVGSYDINSLYLGNGNYFTSDFYSKIVVVLNIKTSTLSCLDELNYIGKGNYFNVTLKDKEGNPLVGETVLITVNDISYSRITDGDGIARLRINLEQGSYSISCTYGVDGYIFSQCNSTLNVFNSYDSLLLVAPKTISFNGKNNDFKVKLIKSNGVSFFGETIIFTINGVTYNRVIGVDGFARLKINLDPGEYLALLKYKGNIDYLTSTKMFVK